MKYHHIGIPTRNKLKDEKHLKDLRMYVSGYGRSPYGVEWNRYEEDAPYPQLSEEKIHSCVKERFSAGWRKAGSPTDRQKR